MNKRGKITLSILIILFILMSFLSLYSILATSDNIKQFEKGNLKYGKITILDFRGTKLAEYILLDNTDQCLTNCYAEGTTIFYSSGKLFDDINFKNIARNLININSKIIIEVNSSYQIEVNDYNEKCEEKEVNKSFQLVCEKMLVGTHKETRYKLEWQEYKGEVLLEGAYRWRIEGTKKPRESIDWIAVSNGVELNNWAWWNSNWTNCKNITITTSLNQNNAIMETNLTGLVFSNITEIRIINASCNLNGTEVKSTVLKNGSNWVYITFLANLSGGSTVYSVYYNNPTNPAKIEELVDDFCEFDNNSLCLGWTEHDTTGYCGTYSANFDSGVFNLSCGYVKSSVEVGKKNPLIKYRISNSGNGSYRFAGISNGTTYDYLSVTEHKLGVLPRIKAQMEHYVTDGTGQDEILLLDTIGLFGNWAIYYGFFPGAEYTASNGTVYNYSSGLYVKGGTGTKNATASNMILWIGDRYGNGSFEVDYIRAYDTESTYVPPYAMPSFSLGSEETYVYDIIPPETTIPTIIPAYPNTTDDLNCYATLTDDKQVNLTAYWKWYKNSIVNLSGSASVINGTNSLITTFGAGNTTKGEQWICEVKPYDGYNNGTAKNSTNVTILNSLPIQDNPLLLTLSGKNFSYENLTCYNKSTYDADNDNITNIYNWYKNSQPFSALNMPFEINVKDYSGFGNDGTLIGPGFTIGKIGRALLFDGIDDYVYVKDSNSLDFTNKKSWEIWFKRTSFNTLQMLFDKTNNGTNYRLALRPDNKLEFSYFIPPVPTSFVWLTNNTKAEFDLGTYNQTKWNGTAVTLNSTSTEQQIFFDGFESGNFSTYGWVVSGPGNPWRVSNKSPYEGAYHARANRTGAGAQTVLETNISTVGFYNINFSFYVQRVGLEPLDDFSAYYFNGTSWKTLESSAGSPADDLNYTLHSYILSDDANNNPNLKIRFNCTAGASSEWCDVDNVKIKGNDTAFYNNGNYTSNISDAGDISEWKNLSWTKSLPANTNLTFQIRSCDDSLCIGEIFVGSNNTTNTYFTNSEFNDISFIADNRYFQYKAYFSTTDIKKSPGLFSVSVNYIRNVTDGLINLVSTSAITDTNWHYAAITFDNAILTNNFNLYLNGSLETSKTEHNLPVAFNNDLFIGKRYPENNSFFNGAIDEFRIYNYALTQEQIKQRYEETKDGLTSSSKIVEQETLAGDKWMCQVTPNDGEVDGLTKNSSTAEIFWAITFDVRDSYSNISLNGVSISCNYSGFTQAPYTTNPYGPYGFPPGNWECTFSKRPGYYNKTITFTADNDTTIEIKLSQELSLTIEEHTWLEAIYNCLYLGDCRALDLLEQINETTTLVWDQIKRTDQDVVINETVTSYIVNVTSNLSINYTVNVPEKAGYSVGDFLPVRLAYWFLDSSNTTCYDQGDKPTGVEKPYCFPLIAETLGPMKGQINFTVDLRPKLPGGTYTIIRDIEIDPQGNWIKYGQEIIGEVEILDSVSKAFISLTKDKELGSNNVSSSSPNKQETTAETTETKNKESTLTSKPGITGAVTGINISGWQMVAVTGIIAGLFLAVIICQTIIKIKKKVNKILFFFLFFFLSSNLASATQTYLNESNQWQQNLTQVDLSALTLGDIDNDGDLDLALSGEISGAGTTSKIYLNNGTSLIESQQWQQNLTNVKYGSLAFGDIDNDGDLDLALSGCSSGGGYVVLCDDGAIRTFIYINNGTSLVESSQWQQNLTSVWRSALTFSDVDNDAKLDLVLSGDTSSNYIIKIYISNGTTLTESNQWQNNLTGIAKSSVVTGDIDNDGDLDLLISGRDIAPNKLTKVYINNGTSLTESQQWQSNLVNVDDSSIALADFDNDGDLDLSLFGCCDIHRIYRNNGSTFVELHRELTHLGGIFAGSQAFGDYDNDGDLDLVTSGRETYTLLYLYNSSTNNFTNIYTETDPEAHILDVRYSSLAWLDLDNDTDIDLIETGYGGGGGGNVQALVYINNRSLTKNNTNPSPPNSSFSSSYVNNILTLNWGNGSDTETNTSGLYYNLMVGNSTKNHTIVSGVYGGSSNPTGGYFGNMMQRKNITLNVQLEANKTYYWYVQTIDTGLAKSNWSAVQNFTTSLDTTKPNITIENPSPNESLHTTNPYFIFNATITDANLTNVTLYANWTGSMIANETNSSGINGTYTFTKNLTGYSDGIYSWYIKSCDSLSNCQTSETRSFYLDRAYPLVYLISPTNASTWTSSSTVTFSYNVTDIDIANCSLIIDNVIDQTDTTITEDTTQTFTKTMSNADYTWKINCTDYVGYTNSSSIYNLTVSYTAPSDGGGGGGGGAGGGGAATVVTPQPKKFDIDFSKSIAGSFEAKQGDIKTFSFNSQITHKITISELTENSAKLIIESTPIILVLMIGETKQIDMNEDNINDLEVNLTSIQAGKANIILKKLSGADILSREELEEEARKEALFDVKVYILDKSKKVLPGEEVLAKIEIFNINNIGQVDVIVDYYLSDNKTVLTKGSDTLAVEAVASFVRSLKVPEDVKAGIYYFNANITYKEFTTSSKAEFEVSSKEIRFIQKWFKEIIIIVVVLIAIFLIVYLIKIKRKEEKIEKKEARLEREVKKLERKR